MIERFGDGSVATRILIDTGPDLRTQLIAAGVTAIDAVVYTHAHADHVHGIDDLRTFWMTMRHPIPIYSDDATQHRLNEGFGYCFRAPVGSSYPPFLTRHRVEPGAPIVIDGAGGAVTLTPFAQIHGDIGSIGYRVGGVAYSCDFNDMPAASLPMLEGLDLWVLDALRERPHPSHCSLGEALQWIERMHPRHAALTHMTNELDYRTLHRDLPATVEPAYDGLTFEFELSEPGVS